MPHQSLAEISAGAFLIAKAELLTLKGAFADAETALTDADKFDQQHPGAAMTWSSTGAPLLVARAFLLEKKEGDLKGAAAAYEAILDAAKEKRASNKYLFCRLWATGCYCVAEMGTMLLPKSGARIRLSSGCRGQCSLGSAAAKERRFQGLKKVLRCGLNFNEKCCGRNQVVPSDNPRRQERADVGLK